MNKKIEEIKLIFNYVRDLCDTAYMENWDEELQAEAFYQIMDEMFRFERRWDTNV